MTRFTGKTKHPGGKAASLLALKKNGFNVPHFFVIDQTEISKLTSQDIVNRINAIGSRFVAVRSSANVEDGIDHSFAGIFETKLNVKPEDAINAVNEVFQSKQNEKVRQYIREKNLDLHSIKLSVIVQQMVDAEISGVAFGKNPLKPYLNAIVVNAVYGLVEGLVSGYLEADTYTKTQGNWQIQTADKREQLVFNGTTNVYTATEEGKRRQACLDITQLTELEKTLDHLKIVFGSPQDMEFCYKNGTLYVLQSRPITTLAEANRWTIWDNSNIVESYPGVTLPFTFSFILGIYASVYRNFSRILGVPPAQLRSNKEVFDEMLGHINGRVYYHLINWYKALAMLPAYEINAGFMEKMMGVSEPLGVDIKINGKPGKWLSYFNLFKTLLRLVKINYQLPDTKSDFTQKVNKIIAEYRKKPVETMSAAELWTDYAAFKKILVNEWTPPLANDLLAMIYFGTLQKLCEKWLKSPQLHTELIAGKHRVSSVLPSQALREILVCARHESKFTQLKNESEAIIWQLCMNNSFGKTGNLIVDYIKHFGDRSVGELKLENDTFTQNPESFLTVLKTYTSVPEKRIKHEKAIEIKGIKDLPFYRRKVLNYVINKAAETVADRENLRFDRTRAFGVIRIFVNAMGNQLYNQGLIEKSKDVFYLKEDELSKAINTSDSQNLKSTIARRKEEFLRFSAMPVPPERIYQCGDEWDYGNQNTFADTDLKGIPCCAGEVTGVVRILQNPEDVKSLNGDILVTTSTDPGWITIFQSASGILVERGSTLSHAAIVSREMNIPCIVGIKGLTKKLMDGQNIKMNGRTGMIEVYEN